MPSSIRRSLFVAAPLAVMLVACSDRSVPPPPPPAVAPAPAPAPAVPPPASTEAPVVPPNTATDVETKKGTETGMVGGASGDVASGGKPGSGTVAGGGTGPAESSGTQTENKK